MSRKINVEKVNLPDGDYRAWWTAFKLEISNPVGGTIIVNTMIGSKGIHCTCSVNVVGGDVFMS